MESTEVGLSDGELGFDFRVFRVFVGCFEDGDGFGDLGEGEVVLA